MPKYFLTQKDKKYLTLEIDEKNYNLPLANTMKVKEIRKLMKITKLPEEEQFDCMIEFLSKYMGEEVIDEMLVDDVQEIFELWNRANDMGKHSDDEGNLDLGESTASQDS